MPPEKLSPSDIAARLQALDGWTLDTGGLGIEKSFRLSSFAAAFGFMTEVAITAEKLDHHPEWKNVYRTVDIRLSTHSAKGVSELDFKLAAAIEQAAGRH